MNNKNQKLYVVDTSVTAKLFIDEELCDEVKQIYRQAIHKEIYLLAPELTCYELTNVLNKAAMPLAEVKEHLLFFEEQIKNETLTIIPYSLEILNKASEIASIDTKGQGYISSFDATFHALAILMNAIFITADKSHYRKTKDLVGSIMLLENFYSIG
ncbi:MAG TPA: PIN domain-containing protein [Thiotrichaceae bacterium]|nr:PIN domain-containing protein [Thiotrichaceae bacterium]